MREDAPRLLFVPVSGPFGMGEYARSLAIAAAAALRWPDASIHFALSREAPYASGTPFPHTLFDSSPTFHSAAVIELIRRHTPDVVIFDNAGRTRQLSAAKASGARVVYISSRARQRRKAFRVRWMRLIDEHWIAYPRFIAGELTWLERLRLDVFKGPEIRYLDVILARRTESAAVIRDRLGAIPEDFVLVVPGGGTGHPGAGDAVAQFLASARDLAAAGEPTVFVGGQKAATHGALWQPGPLPQGDLGELMRGARLLVTNGGSTLLQAIACGKACVAAPIAGDQALRIRRCVAAGVALAAPLEEAALRDRALALLKDSQALEALAGRAVALGLVDGVDVALRALAGLI